ncbi:hypothetical protein PAHAL_6G215400 [Panicum hallii]|uniref:Uncharacterized protein n=1 Tax=Panicum hallii TaxID=206008 RepID=A0A2T8IH59_9POAL|nr:hypothetical protein PAHAL_6G215400 [Panicum hallii]
MRQQSTAAAAAAAARPAPGTGPLPVRFLRGAPSRRREGKQREHRDQTERVEKRLAKKGRWHKALAAFLRPLLAIRQEQAAGRARVVGARSFSSPPLVASGPPLPRHFPPDSLRAQPPPGGLARAWL